MAWSTKDCLKLRKEELEKRGAKGFTLMEMLIVVAIISVLIAIAIPVFTAQLERAREATDLANIRSAYAEVMAAKATDDRNEYYKEIEKINQSDSGWIIDAKNYAGKDLTDIKPVSGETWYVVTNDSETGGYDLTKTKPTSGATDVATIG